MADANETPKHAPRLLYRSDRAAMYVGDCRYGIETIFAEFDPKVVLADPPYAFWTHIKDITHGVPYVFSEDIEWIGNVELWYQQWLPKLRQCLVAQDTVAWFFQNPHYFGFLLRWATWLQWRLDALVPLPTIVECQPEVLSRFSNGPFLTVAQAALLAQASQLNRYGSEKPVKMLSLLLEASPPGAVFDLFCGEGSTLEAAMRAGRMAIGFEIEEEIAGRAAARVEAVDQELSRVVRTAASTPDF